VLLRWQEGAECPAEPPSPADGGGVPAPGQSGDVQGPRGASKLLQKPGFLCLDRGLPHPVSQEVMSTGRVLGVATLHLCASESLGSLCAVASGLGDKEAEAQQIPGAWQQGVLRGQDR